MGIRHYIFESIIDESEVIREITWDEYEAVSDVLKGVKGKQLSFNDTFDKDKRVGIPFKSTAKTEIQKLIDFLEKSGYQVDVESATISKDFVIPAGPKKGKKSIKKTRIGKFLTKLHDLVLRYNKNKQEAFNTWDFYTSTGIDEKEKKRAGGVYKKQAHEGVRLWLEIAKLSPILAPEEYKPVEISGNWKEPLNRWDQAWEFQHVLTKELQGFTEFWNKKSEFYRKNPDAIKDDGVPKHTIIISRDPVDVLRMSDFQGITSCHSPSSRGGGESYYKCAIAEAQGHGLVAYMIENSEIPEDFDIHQGEIFADARRDISGINPTSRLRLRKFVLKETGQEIAVPETRVYGKRIPGFREAVLEWAREQRSFKDIFQAPEDDLPSLNDFVRHGGSYGDTKDGEIFNQLLGKPQYHNWNDADHDDVEDEEDNIAAQYEAEAQEVQNYADRTLTHAGVYFEVEEEAEAPYVSFSGHMSIELQDDDLTALVGENWNTKHTLAREMNKHLGQHGIYIGYGEVEFDTADDNVQLSFSTDGHGLDPDGFRGFVNEVVDVDHKYDQVVRLVRAFLIEQEITDPTEHEKIGKNIKDLEDEGERLFKMFETDVDEEDGEIHFISEEPYHISLRGFDKGLMPQRLATIFNEVGRKFLEFLEVEVKKQPPTVQLDLPGVEIDKEKPLELVDLKGSEIDIDITTKVSERYKEYSIGETRIDFLSRDVDAPESVQTAFQYVKWMDSNPKQINRLLQKAYDDAALSMGMHPEMERISFDMTEPFDKHLRNIKDRTDFRPGPDFDRKIGLHMKQEVEYLDLGDDIFISGVNPGCSNTEPTLWLEVFLKELKHRLIKFGRNLLLPLDSLFVHGSSTPDFNTQRKFRDTSKTLTLGKMFMFDKATDVFELYPFVKGKIRPNLEGPMLSVKFDSIRENLLLNNRMLFENDEQISGFVDKLVKDKKTRDLVRMMRPLDVAKVVGVNLDLQPKSACKTALNLIKHAHDTHYEGIGSPGIESNKEFPVPPAKRRGTPKLVQFDLDKDESKNESSLARPQGKSMWGRPGPDDIKPWHFPPEPRDEPEGWPYDDMTVAGMEPSNKSRKRPLTTAKDNSDARTWKQTGNPLNPDLKSRQPGGDGAGGGGVFRLTFQNRGGDMPGAGGRSWVAKGTKGWNSPQGKKFANPDETNDQPKDLKQKPPTGEAMGGISRNVNPKIQNAGDEDEETPSFMKNPPVGSSIPTTNFGGKSPGRPAGYRNWMKK